MSELIYNDTMSLVYLIFFLFSLDFSVSTFGRFFFFSKRGETEPESSSSSPFFFDVEYVLRNSFKTESDLSYYRARVLAFVSCILLHFCLAGGLGGGG